VKNALLLWSLRFKSCRDTEREGCFNVIYRSALMYPSTGSSLKHPVFFSHSLLESAVENKRKKSDMERMACKIGLGCYWQTTLWVKSICFSPLSHRASAHECSTGTTLFASAASRSRHGEKRQHQPPERLHWQVLLFLSQKLPNLPCSLNTDLGTNVG